MEILFLFSLEVNRESMQALVAIINLIHLKRKRERKRKTFQLNDQ